MCAGDGKERTNTHSTDPYGTYLLVEEGAANECKSNYDKCHQESYLVLA